VAVLLAQRAEQAAQGVAAVGHRVGQPRGNLLEPRRAARIGKVLGHPRYGRRSGHAVLVGRHLGRAEAVA